MGKTISHATENKEKKKEKKNLLLTRIHYVAGIQEYFDCMK